MSTWLNNRCKGMYVCVIWCGLVAFNKKETVLLSRFCFIVADQLSFAHPKENYILSYPANTGHSPNAVSMLGQRRRRCANIETALGECPVFAGYSPQHVSCKRKKPFLYF